MWPRGRSRSGAVAVALEDALCALPVLESVRLDELESGSVLISLGSLDRLRARGVLLDKHEWTEIELHAIQAGRKLRLASQEWGL